MRPVGNWLRASAAALLLGVHRTTVSLWIAKGIIPSNALLKCGRQHRVARWWLEQSAPGAGAALLLLAISIPALDCSVDAYALGASHHFRESGLHSVNPGVGAGISARLADSCDWTALTIGYRDSFGHLARASGIGLRGYLGERDGLHLTGAAIVGALQGSGRNGPVLLPVAGVGYGPAALECVYNPDAAMVGAWVRISWVLP